MNNRRCFNCYEDGHYIRDCPQEKRSPYHKENPSGFIRNDERIQNQTKRIFKLLRVETIGQVSAPKHCKEMDKENDLKNEKKPCQMKEHLVEPKQIVGTVCIKRSFEEDSLDIQELDLSLKMLFTESMEMQQNTQKEVMGSTETISRIKENIIIDRVTAASIAVPVVINMIVTNAVIDTRAAVTVLIEKLYDQIPESKRPKLRRTARNLEVAEAGKNLTTGGIKEVEVNLKSETFKWPVYVAPMFLGCDLIDEMKVARVGEKDNNSGLIIYKEAYQPEIQWKMMEKKPW
ncbi:Hypothetical predicted protein [Mytilus galloprovincialis]|uniref:CCHC-type domain-containing protein n=1 Tax=Mytilus galloprovincialis TaxID=29158 RepID=A0A8B6HI12_MYTGA|nr:Hypothetical predicted protein [Mytilus galloprovincialis]